MPPDRSAGPPRRCPLQISIVWRTRRWPRLEPILRRVGRLVARAEGFRWGQLCVAILGAQYMRSLHRRFYGTPEAGDVLAFDLGCNRKTGRMQADIAICAEVALRYCRQVLGLPPSAAPESDRALWSAVRGELALYLTHGILHLAGYDDDSPRGFRRMHAREEELLAACGLRPLRMPRSEPAGQRALSIGRARHATRRRRASGRD